MSSFTVLELAGWTAVLTLVCPLATWFTVLTLPLFYTVLFSYDYFVVYCVAGFSSGRSLLSCSKTSREFLLPVVSFVTFTRRPYLFCCVSKLPTSSSSSISELLFFFLWLMVCFWVERILWLVSRRERLEFAAEGVCYWPIIIGMAYAVATVPLGLL